MVSDTNTHLDAAAASVHDTADLGQIRMHYVSAGAGPVVLLCHGFPEYWYGWRHQLHALAMAGFRGIAPDLRGYGHTDAPDDVTAYTSHHTVGDLVALLDHLGIAQAAIVGHDWGATIAWDAAMFRPDRFVAVVGLSVPCVPRGAMSLVETLRRYAPPDHYMLYFQEPGVAERELDADPRTFLRRILFTNSGSLAHGRVPNMRVAYTGRLTDSLEEPAAALPWLSDADLDAYTAEFQRTGFRGALNGYRSLHSTWLLKAAWEGATITVPAFYIGGTRDVVVGFPGMRASIDAISQLAPKAEPTLWIEGAGHFLQHEAAPTVNAGLIQFLSKVY